MFHLALHYLQVNTWIRRLIHSIKQRRVTRTLRAPSQINQSCLWSSECQPITWPSLRENEIQADMVLSRLTWNQSILVTNRSRDCINSPHKRVWQLVHWHFSYGELTALTTWLHALDLTHALSSVWKKTRKLTPFRELAWVAWVSSYWST